MNNNIDHKVDRVLSDLKISTAPVNVLEIARIYNIKVSFEDLNDDVSGFLVIKNGNATIAVNDNHHLNRQRFTIAHELGHYFLHSKKNGDDMFVDEHIYHRNSEANHGTLNLEKEANSFAAILLMPENILKDVLDKDDYDFSDELSFHMLAKKFGVSEQAMGYRLGRLRLFF